VWPIIEAAARLLREHPEIELVCGVSLPLLVRFLQHRQRMEYKDLVDVLRRTSQEQACAVPG